jgi:hypothetical protein
LKKNLVVLELLMCLLAVGAFAETGAKQFDLKQTDKALRTQQYSRAFELYRQAAVAGDAKAQ